MSRPSYSLWLGWDPREHAAFCVARHSAQRHCTHPGLPIRGIVLDQLISRGLYTRPMEWRKSAVDRPIMWDTISDAPMSTQHACARFLIKQLSPSGVGWALFCDGDVLFRGNVMRLFDSLNPASALYCVKHQHAPTQTVKMDGQVQTQYGRKNWSSVFAINCNHPSNNRLTLELINSIPGRDLHRFCWLNDDEIGELGPEWNYLVGESPKLDDPKIVHFTSGVPDMPGYETCEFAADWRAELQRDAV